MKQTILILIAIFSISILNAQEYINIGSSKNDVKKVMGEPISIENYQYLEEEVWRYGEYGSSIVIFKNGKIFGYNDSYGILKIGKINTRSTLPPIKKLPTSDDKEPKKRINLIDILSKEQIRGIYSRQATTSNRVVYHPQLSELRRLTGGRTPIFENIVDYSSILDQAQPSDGRMMLLGILCISCIILFLIIRFVLIRKKIKFTDEGG